VYQLKTVVAIASIKVLPVKYDLTGMELGYLRVIGTVKNPYVKGNETRWECLCQNCGRIVEVGSYMLRHSNPYGHCKCTRFDKNAADFKVKK
jgi:hypothetical protein